MLNQYLQQLSTLCHTSLSPISISCHYIFVNPPMPTPPPPSRQLATFINFNKPKLLTWLCSSHSVLCSSSRAVVVCHASYSAIYSVFFPSLFWPTLPNCVTTISLSALFPLPPPQSHPAYHKPSLCRIFLCKSLRLQ